MYSLRSGVINPYVQELYPPFGGYKSLRSRVVSLPSGVVSLRLGVTKSLRSGVVSLRLEVVFLTFGGYYIPVTFGGCISYVRLL